VRHRRCALQRLQSEPQSSPLPRATQFAPSGLTGSTAEIQSSPAARPAFDLLHNFFRKKKTRSTSVNKIRVGVDLHTVRPAIAARHAQLARRIRPVRSEEQKWAAQSSRANSPARSKVEFSFAGRFQNRTTAFKVLSLDTYALSGCAGNPFKSLWFTRGEPRDTVKTLRYCQW